MIMTSGSWKPLSVVSNIGTDAPLLIKYCFTAAAYCIYLTDLTQLWSESLDRRQIIRKALDAETSIDPSEGTDQLSLLLQEIQGALEGRHETKLLLSWGGNEKDLFLEITASLPAPLRLLEWRLSLVPAPQALLTTELLLPCLLQQVITNSETTSLLELLKEKDHVISRLIDRLQTTGTEMTTVFPGAVGLRSSKTPNGREVVARTVKGLGEFNESKWRKELPVSFNPPTKIGELVQRVFSGNLPEPSGIKAAQVDSMWWKHLKKDGLSGDHAPGILLLKSNTTSSPKSSRGSSVDDAGFQRLSTPTDMNGSNLSGPKDVGPVVERQHGAQSTPKPSGYNDASTDEDEDDEVHVYQSNSGTGRETHSNDCHAVARADQPPRPKSMIANSKKLGLVGGMQRNPITLKESPVRKLPSLASKQYTDSGASTVGESWSSIEQDPKSPNSTAKANGRLGFIGGGRGKGSETRGRPAEVGENKPVPPRERNRDIGNESTVESLSILQKSNSPIESTLIVPTSPMPTRESSQERADKKRELLKRQLEEKAKALTKKKRKF